MMAWLEFTIFYIENLAESLHREPVEIYNLLAKESDILHSYIIPYYEPLHSQGKEYIIEESTDVMK